MGTPIRQMRWIITSLSPNHGLYGCERDLHHTERLPGRYRQRLHLYSDDSRSGTGSDAALLGFTETIAWVRSK